MTWTVCGTRWDTYIILSWLSFFREKFIGKEIPNSSRKTNNQTKPWQWEKTGLDINHSRKDTENSPASALAPATDSCEGYRDTFWSFSWTFSTLKLDLSSCSLILKRWTNFWEHYIIIPWISPFNSFSFNGNLKCTEKDFGVGVLFSAWDL